MGITALYYNVSNIVYHFLTHPVYQTIPDLFKFKDRARFLGHPVHVFISFTIDLSNVILTNGFSSAENSIQKLCKIANSTIWATSNFFAVSHMEPYCSIILFTCKQSQFTLFESYVEFIFWLVCYSNLQVLEEENFRHFTYSYTLNLRRGPGVSAMSAKTVVLVYLAPCDPDFEK